MKRKFDGECIEFGSEKYPNWITVSKYLMKKEFNLDI